MKSIIDVLSKGNEQIAGLRDTLIKAREALVAQRNHYPDLADALNPQIADLDAKIALLAEPFDAAGLTALGATVLAELKQIGTLHFTPTPHASSGA